MSFEPLKSGVTRSEIANWLESDKVDELTAAKMHDEISKLASRYAKSTKKLDSYDDVLALLPDSVFQEIVRSAFSHGFKVTSANGGGHAITKAKSYTESFRKIREFVKNIIK
jgi:hypothetical protein